MTEQIFNVSPDPGSPLEFLRLVIDEEMPARVIKRNTTRDFFFVYMPQRAMLGDIHQPLRCPAHSWVCYGPHHCHHYGWAEDSWRHSCFHVRGPRAMQIFSALPLNTPAQLAHPIAVQQLLQTLFSVISVQNGPDTDVTAALLEALVRLCQQAPQAEADSDMLELWRYLQQHFSEQHSLDSLAERMHCSASSLRQRFKERFGISVIEHLIQLRMQEASYLLRQPELPVSDIARRVGYQDSAYFSRMVKKHFGKSPRALRREHAR